jgi:phospholipase/carboxylesterase
MPSESKLDFIHRFVPGTASRTLLLLHGTGGNEDDLLSLGRMLDRDAALLSPRGKVLENGMPRFFRRLAEGVFDQEDLIRRTHQLADFIRAAIATHRLDSANLIAVGYSNGANIAAALLLLEPGVLSGAALLHAMVPLVPETLPKLNGTPVFLSAGNQDPIVPRENTRELAALLRRAGAEVSVAFDDAGHSLSTEAIETTRRWLTAQSR